MAVRQGKLDSFVEKTGSSPRAQRVQSGPIRHATASKNVRHSPMSKPGGSSVNFGDRDDGSHTGRSAQRSGVVATPGIHSQASTYSPLEAGRQNPPAVSRKVHLSEVKGDLFSCPSSASLAHCVSEDMHMGKGIATLFKQKFGGVGELKSQGVKTGGLAVLRRDDRFVYYLVTKVRYFHKPTYDTLRSSLQAMKDHCVSNGVQELCMPRIGCGLDRLKWERVVEMIQEIFTKVDISITVYYL